MTIMSSYTTINMKDSFAWTSTEMRKTIVHLAHAICPVETSYEGCHAN